MINRRARRDIGPAVYAKVLQRLERHAERFPTLAAFCAHVSVDQSILTRWRNGSTPSLATYLTIFDELDQLDLEAPQ